MGQSSNNPFRQGGQLMSEYTIDKKIPEHFITLLTHKTSRKQYLLREQTFNDIREYTITLETLIKRKDNANRHLTNVIRIEERSQDHLCSNFYKIYSLWEYPAKSLKDEINQRALLKRRFQNKQLWSILACSIMGLAALQQRQIKHECLTPKAILTDFEGNVKILDPIAYALQPNIDLVYNNRNVKHIYLSPEQCQSIQTQKPIINKNSFRNDVFVLGMILLQCGLLQNQDQCYLNECSQINFDKLQVNLRRFGQIYQQELMKMIQLMLNRDIRNRPDWIDLDKYANKNSKSGRNLKPQKVDSKPTHRSYISRVGAQFESKKVGNQLQPEKPIVQPPKSIFYKDQHHIIPSSYAIPSNNFSSQEVKTNNLPFTSSQHGSISQNFPPTNFIKPQDYSYKPPETQNYISSSNPFTLTFNNSQQFQSQTSPPTYFSPLLPQISVPKNNSIVTQKLNSGNFSNSYPKQGNVIGTNFNFTQPYFPRLDENKQSIASNITNIIDQKQPYYDRSQSHLNQYVRPAQSVNYQIYNKSYSPLQKSYEPRVKTLNYLLDPKLTTTPQIVDQSQLQIQPSFVEEHFKLGSKYEGYKLNGMRHGKGKFFYQDGGSYDGQWRQNKMEGFGILYYQSNAKAYEGNWINDQFQGFGKLYNQNPHQLKQSFDYTNFDEIDEYWTSYEGNFTQDLKDGKGTLRFSNGEVFEGTFKDDMVQGQGTFYCRNGNKIHGIWYENRLQKTLQN